MTTAPPLRDREQCDALIRQWRPLVYFVLGKLRRKPAVRLLHQDDAVACGLVALWRAAQSWREDGAASFQTWAFLIVRRELMDAARVPKRHGPPTVSLAYDPLAPQPGRDGWLNGEDLARQLARMPARERRTLEGLYLDGSTTADVAATLGVTKQRVLEIRDRALAHLRRLLEGAHPSPEPDSTPFFLTPLEALKAMQANPNPTAQPQPPGALLTIEQVAKRLGVARRSVWRWVEQGRLPAPLKLSGQCRRWRSEQLEEYLNRLEQQASA